MNRRGSNGRLTTSARLRRAALVSAALAAALLLSLPRLARHVLASAGREFGLEIQCARAEVSLLAGTAAFRDVVIETRDTAGAADKKIGDIPALTIELDPAALAAGRLRIRAIRAERPTLRLDIEPGGRSALERVLRDAPARVRAAGGAAVRPPLEAPAIEVTGATVELRHGPQDAPQVFRATFAAGLERLGGELRLHIRGEAAGIARALEAAARIRPAAAPGGAFAIEGYARGEGLSLASLDRLLPPLVRLTLEDGRVEIAGSLAITPLAREPSGIALDLALDRLRVEERGRALAAIAGLAISAPRIDPAAPALVLDRVAARELRADIERDPAGRLCAAGLSVDPRALMLPRPEPAAGPPALAVRDASLSGAVIGWRDDSVSPPLATALRLDEFSLGPDLRLQASLDGVVRRVELAARTADGEAGRSVTLSALAAGIDLAPLAPYLAAAGARPALANGRFAMDAHATVAALGGGRYRIGAEIDRAALSEGARVIAALGRVRVEAPLLDLALRRIEVGALELRDSEARLRRRPDGSIEALGIATAGPLDGAASTGCAATATAAVARPAAGPWSVALRAARAEGLVVDLLDDAADSPRAAKVDVRDLRLADLRLPASPTPCAFALDLRAPGIVERLLARGTARASGATQSLAASLRVEALRPERLSACAPAAISFTAALVTATAELALEAVDLGPDAFGGEAALSRVALADASGPLAAIDEVRIRVRRAAPAAGLFEIDSLEVIGPDLRIERRPDGRLAALGCATRDPVDFLPSGARGDAAPPAPASAPPAGARPPLVTIDDLRISDGRLAWRDRALAPPAGLEIRDLDLRARRLGTAGLRGEPAPPASIVLRLAIPGAIENLRMDADLRLGVGRVADGIFILAARDVLLAPLSPYVQAASGVVFDAGRARLLARIALAPTRFQVDGHAVIRDLALSGEGAKALILRGSTSPMSLESAAALLCDDDGVIDLRVPIAGDRGRAIALEGVVGDAILEAVSSSVKKALSPLKRLLFGRRPPDLRFPRVPFEPGRSALGPAGERALDEAARLLAARPDAAVLVRGDAQPAADLPPALLLAATADPLAGGDPAAARSARALARERLRGLAASRAGAVREGLLRRGIAPGRIRLLDPVDRSLDAARAAPRAGRSPGVDLEPPADYDD
jgi:hypothetical protein